MNRRSFFGRLLTLALAAKLARIGCESPTRVASPWFLDLKTVRPDAAFYNPFPISIWEFPEEITLNDITLSPGIYRCLDGKFTRIS